MPRARHFCGLLSPRVSGGEDAARGVDVPVVGRPARRVHDRDVNGIGSVSAPQAGHACCGEPAIDRHPGGRVLDRGHAGRGRFGRRGFPPAVTGRRTVRVNRLAWRWSRRRSRWATFPARRLLEHHRRPSAPPRALRGIPRPVTRRPDSSPSEPQGGSGARACLPSPRCRLEADAAHRSRTPRPALGSRLARKATGRRRDRHPPGAHGTGRAGRAHGYGCARSAPRLPATATGDRAVSGLLLRREPARRTARSAAPPRRTAEPPDPGTRRTARSGPAFPRSRFGRPGSATTTVIVLRKPPPASSRPATVGP